MWEKDEPIKEWAFKKKIIRYNMLGAASRYDSGYMKTYGLEFATMRTKFLMRNGVFFPIKF
jgi:hypothetical protein